MSEEVKIAEQEKVLAPDHEPIVGRPGFTKAYRGVPLDPPARYEKDWGCWSKGTREELRFYDTQQVWRSTYRRVEDRYELVGERDGVLREDS